MGFEPGTSTSNIQIIYVLQYNVLIFVLMLLDGNSDGKSGSLSGGVIIGAAVGGALLIIAIVAVILVVVFCVRQSQLKEAYLINSSRVPPEGTVCYYYYDL